MNYTTDLEKINRPNNMGWRERIIHLLNGEAFGIPQERLGWNGYISVYNLFIGAQQEQQDEIIDAMLQIINDAKNSKDEEPWLLAADVIHLVYSLKIEEGFKSAVAEINPKTAPTEHSRNAMQCALDTYHHTSHSVDTNNAKEYMPCHIVFEKEKGIIPKMR